MNRLVLASTSPYRRALLERMRLDFDLESPDVDESQRPGETPREMVRRLARDKARAVSPRRPDGLIVGSDQVAVLDGQWLGKPGDFAANVEQLMRTSGRRVRYLTGVCVLDAPSGEEQDDVVGFDVVMRRHTRERIEAYVARERAFDCAGGFRCEALGPVLFERMEGDDPTALVGLPLIRLVSMLARAGYDVLLEARPVQS